MPYISDKRRKALEQWDRPRNAGELNFVITSCIERYLKYKELSYQTCNDIVGALDNAKHEFHRRVQDQYEDTKIVENGDVYRDFEYYLVLPPPR